MRAKPIAITVGLLLLAYAAAGPYITVHQIKSAARARDGEALSEHVDFASLRQSFKDQLNAMLASELSPELSKGNGFAALGAAFAGVMVDKAVDAYVTPAGLTMMLKGERPSSSESTAKNSDQGEPFNGARMFYASLNKFVVESANEDGDEVRFIFRRRGIDWKLAEIILPMNGASANKSLERGREG